eukprot:189834-Ditylum_brightwellii.AAC.1
MEEKYTNTREIDTKKSEEIDEVLHNAVMDAVALLPPVPRAWWYPEIGTSCRIQQYWKTDLSFKWNNMDSSRELDTMKRKLPEDVDILQGDPAR